MKNLGILVHLVVVTAAIVVRDPKIILSVGISLIGGEPEPLHCFFIISRNTMAIGVDHATEVSLPTEVPEIRNGMLDGIASFARSL